MRGQGQLGLGLAWLGPASVLGNMAGPAVNHANRGCAPGQRILRAPRPLHRQMQPPGPCGIEFADTLLLASYRANEHDVHAWMLATTEQQMSHEPLLQLPQGKSATAT